MRAYVPPLAAVQTPHSAKVIPNPVFRPGVVATGELAFPDGKASGHTAKDDSESNHCARQRITEMLMLVVSRLRAMANDRNMKCSVARAWLMSPRSICHSGCHPRSVRSPETVDFA